MKWNELADKVENLDQWHLSYGEALWINQNPRIGVHVRIWIDPKTLSPERERLRKYVDNEDITLEGFYLRNTVVTYKEAKLFIDHWVELWDHEPPWIHLVDSPPEGHQKPRSLEFLPLHYDKFYNYRISSTHMAPLWGQDRSYFKEEVKELNSFGKQNNSPHVKYQQSWVEKKMVCPFCNHKEWNQTYAMSLNEPDEFVYDKEKRFYALLCPSCDRCVEIIDRSLII